ncbi:MAG: FAD:protein FMN transferase [Vallitalea sp.]|jgi:thiamine biosynthesis lipoprotein|nr:FAD:protein FMN transferase [Vallitalea sp.]
MKKVFIFILIMMLLTGCNNKYQNKKVAKETFLLGTLVKISIYGKDVKDEDFKPIFSLISDLENKVSKNIKESEISKLNSNTNHNIQVSQDVFNIIKKGLYYSKISEGKFDLSIAPLVELWGIGTENAKVPKEDEIDKAISKINYKNIKLDEKDMTISLLKDTKIDLGGIAKGYIADKVAEFFKDNDIEHGVINLGGNILTVGQKPNGDLWKIGIQNPFKSRGEKIGMVSIDQKSVVTSGIYERYLEKDGIRYHHILNPFTGYPVKNNLASVIIISNYSVDGDGLSTVAFSKGLKDGLKFIETIDNTDAIFITKDKEIYLTSGAKKIFKLMDNSFKIKYNK